MDIEYIIMIIAILVEGPIVWWLTSRHRKEDNTMTLIKEVKASVRKLHERIDGVEGSAATVEYVDKQDNHVKEVVSLQFAAIMENLDYIRSRLDEQSKK